MRTKRIWQSAVAQILSKKWNNLPAPDVVAILAQEVRGSKERGRTNLEEISASVGVSIQYEPLRVDALLQQTQSGYVAIINSAANKARQRFSLAHEIGHLAMFNATGLRQAFGHLSPSERQNPDSFEVENLCDCFASELLMPLKDWQQHIFEEGISLQVIRNLMHSYGVSMAAATKKVVDADIWHCAIIIWEAVYKSDKLEELKPVQTWTNIALGTSKWPKSMPNSPAFRLPGSPLYALERGTETIGETLLPFDQTTEKYLAQSSIVRKKPLRVATLILAEPHGRGILLRFRKHCGALSDNRKTQTSK